MSLLPLFFGDGWWDRPSRILDQHFGMTLDPEDLLAPLTVPCNRSYGRPSGYYRPWKAGAASNDTGSTILSDKNKFQVNLDVQQFSPNEISVKVTGSNTVTVEGKHEEKQDEHGYISRQFVRRYVLPEGHNLEKVQSTLSSDGVLTITAPREATELERNVPIQHTGTPSKTVEMKKEEEDPVCCPRSKISTV